MPIYEYQCESCGHEMEALQKMSDDALRECPECHANDLKKLISASGFRLSGSGWYETDFKSGNKKNVTDKNSSGTSVDTKKSDSNSSKSSSSSNNTNSTNSTSSKKKPSKAAAK